MWYREFAIIDPAPDINAGKKCHWNRLDALRFMSHSCFGLNADRIYRRGFISVCSVPTGLQISSSTSPILFIEVRVHNAEHPTKLIEPEDEQQSIVILHEKIQRITRLNIFPLSNNTEHCQLEAPADLYADMVRIHSYYGRIYRTMLKGSGKIGSSFASIPASLKNIRIYSGLAVDGIEFVSATGSVSLFGKRGGSPKDMVLNDGEVFLGFVVQSGSWVDAIAVVTNQRTGPLCGSNVGSYSELVVPIGMMPFGLTGELDDWVLAFALEFVPVRTL